MVIVFEYGKLMDIKEFISFLKFCYRDKFDSSMLVDLDRAELNGQRLEFNLRENPRFGPTANLVKGESKDRVVGRLYQLSDEVFKFLYGSAQRREPTPVKVVDKNGKTISAITGIAGELGGNLVPGRPDDKYYSHCERGLREIGADPEYIAQVRSIAGMSTVRPTEENRRPVRVVREPARRIRVPEVYKNPEGVLPDAICLPASLRTKLGVEVGDSVEVERGGRKVIMRVRKASKDLVDQMGVSISEKGREELGIGEYTEKRRIGGLVRPIYPGVTIRSYSEDARQDSERDSVRQTSQTIGIIGITLSFFFLDAGITGNAIADLTTKNTSYLGIVLLIVGLIFGYLGLEKRA